MHASLPHSRRRGFSGKCDVEFAGHIDQDVRGATTPVVVPIPIKTQLELLRAKCLDRAAHPLWHSAAAAELDCAARDVNLSRNEKLTWRHT